MFILVSVQRTALSSFRIFLQTRIIVDGAKLSSHDSGSHISKLLKMATERKNAYISVTELKLQVRFSTIYDIKVSTLKKEWRCG